jgi:hypothetical protein
MKLFFYALALFLAYASLACGQCQLDDGSAEFYLGVNGGVINWGNAFDTIEGAERLQSIEFAFGIGVNGPLVGESVIWTIFDDDDLDPTNGGLVVLGQGTHIIENDDFAVNGVLDVIDVSSENIVLDGSFFISANFVDNLGMAFPASLDADTVLGQSFFSGSEDPTDYLRGQSTEALGAAGTWVIRAKGIAIPEPATLMFAALPFAIPLIGRRRR